jgi:hypothetical protein
MTRPDVIGPSTGEGDCECAMRSDGRTSVVGACACSVHGMKALRAEVERLRGEIASMRGAIDASRRWTITICDGCGQQVVGAGGHAGRCDPASESEVEVVDAKSAIGHRLEAEIGDDMSEVGETLRHKTIIGRERALIGALAKALNMTVGGPPPSRATAAELRRHRSSKTWETDLGTAFEVQIIGPDGRITGHIARVTVELDRFEAGTAGEKP